MKDLQAHSGHIPKRRKFNKGSVKGQVAVVEQHISVLHSNQGTNAGVAQLELHRIQPHLTPQHPQMPLPTLKTVITIIILLSLTNKPDTMLKGIEKLRDHLEEELLYHLEEELLSQINTQPDTPMQSGLPELALSPSIVNLTMSWTVMQTHVCWENMHTFHGHGKAVNIVGYDKSKGTLASNMKTVSGDLAYDNPTLG